MNLFLSTVWRTRVIIGSSQTRRVTRGRKTCILSPIEENFIVSPFANLIASTPKKSSSVLKLFIAEFYSVRLRNRVFPFLFFERRVHKTIPLFTSIIINKISMTRFRNSEGYIGRVIKVYVVSSHVLSFISSLYRSFFSPSFFFFFFLDRHRVLLNFHLSVKGCSPIYVLHTAQQYRSGNNTFLRRKYTLVIQAAR